MRAMGKSGADIRRDFFGIESEIFLGDAPEEIEEAEFDISKLFRNLDRGCGGEGERGGVELLGDGSDRGCPGVLSAGGRVKEGLCWGGAEEIW